jgi:hypothetical protein
VEEHLEHLLKAADYEAQLRKHQAQAERLQDSNQLKALMMKLVKMKAMALGGASAMLAHSHTVHTTTGTHSTTTIKKINATTTEIITTSVNKTHGCGAHDKGSPKNSIAKMQEALTKLEEQQHALAQRLWIQHNIHLPTPAPGAKKTAAEKAAAKKAAHPDHKPACYAQCNADTTACFHAAKTDKGKDACGHMTAECMAKCGHEKLVAEVAHTVVPAGCAHFKVPPKAPHPCAVPPTETITTKFVTTTPGSTKHITLHSAVEVSPSKKHKAAATHKH